MAPGAKEAAKRRAAANNREGLAQMDRRAHFEAHVRGCRLQNIGVLRIYDCCFFSKNKIKTLSKYVISLIELFCPTSNPI